ncbi:MAG: molybdopterin biosynthesis protein [Chloroflexi bacterium]|nr:molybdopterin biosynthesis protein [Chloroflexota bacterium]
MVYLKDIPLETALVKLNAALAAEGLAGVLGVEEIPLDERASGRVLAEPVWAKLSSPAYHASAMDGFAVQAASTAGAGPATPVMLAIPGQSTYLDTGDPLPIDRDAVIPIENTEALGADGQPAEDVRHPAAIRIRAAVVPWQHVRPMGEDMVASELVLPSGRVLRPVDLGAAAACGQTTLRVSRKPRVAVLPTGSELKPIGAPVAEGEIIESNSVLLAAQAALWGAEVTRLDICPDDEEAIRQQVRAVAGEHDLILVNAGSSAGSEDFTARVVESLGQLLVHGVALRPGHPVIIGIVRSGEKPVVVVGVPGFPVSAALTGEVFVEPLLARWQGRAPRRPEVVEAEITRKLVSPAGDDDYVRVAVGDVGRRRLAAPLARGAGVLSSLVRADGIVILGRGVQGVSAGDTVQVRLYSPRAALGETIFATGSHDLTLDLIAQYLAGRGRRLVTANVGSQAGLVALGRGEAHLAGSHLLDPETGEYNLAFLPRYLPGVSVRVVGLVMREQGLIVKAGNPKKLRTLLDLAQPGVICVNRQRGAGTRVLLDYLLQQNELAPEALAGYEHEVYTHLGVAAAVASGQVDCGLGVAAAAHALGLDFVPLHRERYDIIVAVEHADSPLLEPLWAALSDAGLKEQISALPGYDTHIMGELIAEAG